MKRKNLVLWLTVVVTFSMAVNALGAEPVVVEGIDDLWIRENGGGAYESDGICPWSSDSPDGARRYGLLEFDLSSLSGQTFLFAVLELWSPIHSYSDYSKPIKQSAYVIDCSSGTALLDLDWASYMSEKDAGKQALESLGSYDLPAANTDPRQQDQYVPSYASVADMAKIQAAIDGDGKFSLVLITAEDGTDYGQSWGDGEASWAGAPNGDPRLTFYTERPGGPVINISPSNGASNVSVDAVLDWEAILPFYNEPPTYTVYFDTDSDPNNGTIVNINDSGITSYDPDLTYNTTYWWRVDVTDPNSGGPVTYQGETWLFTTAPFGTEVLSLNEIWIRAAGAYEDDAIWVQNSTAGERRYGLVEFDVSGFNGQKIANAHLQLHSDSGNNAGLGAMKQTAYMIDCTEGTALVDLDWTSYNSEKDPNKVLLESLGRYDLPDFDSDPSQQNSYVGSQASVADLALVQSAIDGDGLWSMVLIADEDGTAHARMWGDGVIGSQPRLIISSGSAFNPTPADEAPNVEPSVVLEWEVYAGLYNDPPTFTVYLDDDPDLSDAIPIDNGTSTSYDPSPDLEYTTTYHWRVDVTDSNSGNPITYPGVPWSFTTKNYYAAPTLINPQPTDDLDVDDVLLEWSHPDAGEAGVEFKISYRKAYFGPFIEVTTISSTSYDLSANVQLAWGTEYDWRVDVVVNSVVEREGDVWQFTTHTLECNYSPHDVTGPDGVPDCFVDLFDFASFASDWLKCGIDRDVGDCIWPRPTPPYGISLEVWIRESAPDTTYENDGMNIYNSQVTCSGCARRAGLLEFDVSSAAGKTVTGARLWVWQIGSWSSVSYPCKTHALVVDPNQTPFGSTTWNTYQAEYAGTEVALESLGVYDVSGSVPSEQDVYIPSLPASAADLALIQAEADGDGVLSISLWADEDPVEYRMDFADDAYFGYRAILEVETQ